MRQRGLVCVLAIGLALVAVACAPPDPGASVDAGGPDRASFPPVAQMLGRRCGTFDCHGSIYRNLRIYGHGGLRLDPKDRPDTPLESTPAENDATYEAVVGLEPEKMHAVVAARGVGVDDLTLVRKGRGEEGHKGKQLIVRNDDADLCLVGWISGTPNPDACARASAAP